MAAEVMDLSELLDRCTEAHLKIAKEERHIKGLCTLNLMKRDLAINQIKKAQCRAVDNIEQEAQSAIQNVKDVVVKREDTIRKKITVVNQRQEFVMILRSELRSMKDENQAGYSEMANICRQLKAVNLTIERQADIDQFGYLEYVPYTDIHVDLGYLRNLVIEPKDVVLGKCRLLTVGQHGEIPVTLKAKGKAELLEKNLKVSMADSEGACRSVEVKKVDETSLKVHFDVQDEGVFHINAKLFDVHIGGSPLEIIAISKVTNKKTKPAKDLNFTSSRLGLDASEVISNKPKRQKSLSIIRDYAERTLYSDHMAFRTPVQRINSNTEKIVNEHVKPRKRDTCIVNPTVAKITEEKTGDMASTTTQPSKKDSGSPIFTSKLVDKGTLHSTPSSGQKSKADTCGNDQRSIKISSKDFVSAIPTLAQLLHKGTGKAVKPSKKASRWCHHTVPTPSKIPRPPATWLSNPSTESHPVNHPESSITEQEPPKKTDLNQVQKADVNKCTPLAKSDSGKQHIPCSNPSTASHHVNRPESGITKQEPPEQTEVSEVQKEEVNKCAPLAKSDSEKQLVPCKPSLPDGTLKTFRKITKTQNICSGPVMQGTLISRFGMFESLAGLSTTFKDIVVCDAVNNQVMLYSFDGRLKMVLGSGESYLSFDRPTSAVLDDYSGNIYIKDNHSIHVISYNGIHIGKMGCGILEKPSGLEWTDTGHLVTLDNGRQKIFLFSTAGKLVSTLKFYSFSRGSVFNSIAVYKDKLIAVDAGLHIGVIANLADGIATASFGRLGSAPGQFIQPSSVCCDKQGNLFVADSELNRIQVFNMEGKYVSQLQLADPVIKPSAMHVTDDGHLLINSQLVVYHLCSTTKSINWQVTNDQNQHEIRMYRLGGAQDPQQKTWSMPENRATTRHQLNAPVYTYRVTNPYLNHPTALPSFAGPITWPNFVGSRPPIYCFGKHPGIRAHYY